MIGYFLKNKLSRRHMEEKFFHMPLFFQVIK